MQVLEDLAATYLPDLPDVMLTQFFFEQTPAAHSMTFRAYLDVFLAEHFYSPFAKFSDLPRVERNEILRKAAVDLCGPAN